MCNYYFAGDLKLTYFGTWDNIQPQINPQLVEQLYVAPGMYTLISAILFSSQICLELCATGKPAPSADWWSLGVILYEVLTSLVSIRLLVYYILTSAVVK